MAAATATGPSSSNRAGERSRLNDGEFDYDRHALSEANEYRRGGPLSSSTSTPRTGSGSGPGPGPRRRAAKAVVSVADQWVAQLRRRNSNSNELGGHDNDNDNDNVAPTTNASHPNGARSSNTRMTGWDGIGGAAGSSASRRAIAASSSTQSLLRPPSSAASMLSLETPVSPTTTMSAHSYSTAPAPSPLHRHSAGPNYRPQHPSSHSPHHPHQFQPPPYPHHSSSSHPHRHPPSHQHSHHHSDSHQRPSGSHVSLPTLPSASSSSSHPRHHPHPHPHPHSHPHEPRYDAEFDRGTSSRGNASSARNLFNPDAPIEPVATSNRRREQREDGPSSASSRKQRSKRDVVDPIDLGRRVMRDSKDSIESEDSVASGARPASRSSKEGGRVRRSRREDTSTGRNGRRGEEVDPSGASSTSLGATVGGVNSSSAAAASSTRQLFDPRRDDPVKFAQGVPTHSRKGTGPGGIADSRSFVSSVASLVSAPSQTSEHSVGMVPTPSTAATGPEELEQSKAPSENPVVAQLKRAYREIVELETKLQDENKAAMAAMQRDDESSHQGVRIKGAGKRYDDEYWVKLASGHKQLADAHYSFLQMALDPRLPTSLHSLPQKYNIPTRLWQTAFHQLLERMRHAVLANPSSNSGSSSSPSSEANVMEHLVEFIQYAYGHYSQLFEDQAVNAFRSAWIEQLGDLARYRMAVAGLASRVSAVAAQSTTTNGGTLNLPSSPKQTHVEPRPIEAASIGVPALNDWDLEEQETWRVMARDWYGQGIAEAPGTGRLHHHLALLSKGDDLRGLYHYSKSLTAAHPYVSARESILPLFEEEHQARRTQPDVTKDQLFVHLHGMLFTKISLDDFDECLDRLLERLQEEAVYLRRVERDWASLGTGPTAPFSEVEWFMLGVINISALLQYGAEDGVLKKAMTKEPHLHPTHSRAAAAAAAATKARTPQAIMLNPASMKRGESKVEQHDDEDGDAQQAPTTGSPEVVMQLHAAADDDDPLVFRLAQRLTFALLDHCLQTPTRIVGDSYIVNPYIILVLTFLGHVSQFPDALRHLERAVPWSRLVDFFNTIPSTYDVRPDAPIKLTGGPLPEDWCVRGMDWIGKHLFSRGYWKAKTIVAGGRRDEFAPPPPIEGLAGTIAGATVESEMDALRFDLAALDQFVDEETDRDGTPTTASAHLASMRWRRLATVAGWSARNVAGLDVDAYAAAVGAPRFVVSGGLDSKLRRWQREDKEAEEVERRSKLAARQRAGGDDEEEDESASDDEEEDDEDDENDSPTVRELKARRRHLKAVIKQARLATRGTSSTSIRRLGGSSSKKRKSNSTAMRRTLLKVSPGYTVLVFDTNILLTSMKLFRDLVEAEAWTIVVPLAVITELDGLRRNESPLGVAATEAISYLETAIRTHGRHLKIQTSRGNYLRDLSIRSEAIDFSSIRSGDDGDGAGFSHDFARSMDDVILRAVAWQKEHFTNRVALVNPKRSRVPVPHDTSQVVLVTFDRNLRLKARARGLDAADEDGMALMLEDVEGG